MRKKITLCLVAAFITTGILHAQVEKGDWLLGGAFGYNSWQSQTSAGNSNASILPRIGYAIGRNSVLNAKLGVSYGKTSSEDGTFKNTQTVLSVGMGFRKFYTIKNKFGMFGEAYGTVAYGEATSSGPGIENVNTSTNYSVGLTPGFYYHATPGILLSADVGGFFLSRSIQNPNYNSSRSTSIGLTLFNSFTFGIDFILGKKNS